MKISKKERKKIETGKEKTKERKKNESKDTSKNHKLEFADGGLKYSLNNGQKSMKTKNKRINLIFEGERQKERERVRRF